MTRPEPHIVKAKKREIAVRYRSRRVTNMATLRMPDINRLIDYRFSEGLPDDDNGRSYVRVAVHHLAQISGEGQPRILAWIAQRAPWMDGDELEELLAAAFYKPIRWRARTLGETFRLTDVERTALKITTIRAIDVTDTEMLERRKERDRVRAAARRRANGAVPRKAYEAAAIGQGKPWIAAGVSQSTWYRRQKAASVTAQ